MKNKSWLSKNSVKQSLVSSFAWGIRNRKSIHDILTKALDRIDNLQSDDVVLVFHGKWIDKTHRDAFGFATELSMCSVCNENFRSDCLTNLTPFNDYFGFPAYCPNCGARMDLEVRDDL